MNYYEISKEQRDRGKKGLNKGIPIALAKFKKYIPNIQKGKFYLIAADSGTGKTKLSNYLFVYTPFFQWVKSGGQFDIDINYYTAEMPVEEIIAEFQAYWIYLVTGKTRLIDTDQIYSYGEAVIAKDIDNLLNSKECIDITNTFQQKVRIVNESFGAKYLYKQLIASAEKHGKITWKKIDDTVSFVENYEEYNPNMYNINIVDNFQRLQRIQGENAKTTIDQVSRHMDWGRQKFNQIWVGLNQINRNTKNLDRYKLGQFFPGPESLKDSENPYHDCQICMVLISPKGLNLKDFDGYKILHNSDGKGLMDRLRPIKILKNRGGIANKTGYLGFLGECAHFFELPEATELNSTWYNDFHKKYGE
jgi:hypothetical protein